MKESRRVPLIVYILLSLLIFALLAVGASFLGRQKPDGGTAVSSPQPRPAESAAESRPAPDESASSSPSYPEGSGAGTRWDLNAAENYDIQIGFGEVELRPTRQTPCVTVESDRKITVEQTVTGETCRLRFDAGRRLGGKWDVAITVWLPEENLRELTVGMAAGALRVAGVRADEFSLDMSAGLTTVEDCAFRESDFELTAGELTYSAGSAVQKIDAKVTAGLMKLRLPKTIPSFRLDYEATLGGFDNQSGFSMDGEQKSFLIGGSGSLRCGPQPPACRIELEVSAGSLQFSDY